MLNNGLKATENLLGNKYYKHLTLLFSVIWVFKNDSKVWNIT